jgi:hypothetical protein
VPIRRCPPNLYAISAHSIVIGVDQSTHKSHSCSFISRSLMNEMTPSVFLRKNGRRKQREATLCPDVSHIRALDFKMNTKPHFISERRRPRPIRKKMRLRVHFEPQCFNMRHIGIQCGSSLLTSSILSQKYRRCHFIHQITGYE